MSLSPESPTPSQKESCIVDISCQIQLPGIQEKVSIDLYSWTGGVAGIGLLHLLSEALNWDPTLVNAVAKYTVGGYFGSRMLGPYFRAAAIGTADLIQNVRENINLE